MSTVTKSLNQEQAAKRTPLSSFRNASAGFGIMVRFILRRNWLRMLIWLVVLAGMIVSVVQSQAELFPTQSDRDAYAQIANTPAIAALTGLPYAASTLGGILNIKIWMTIAVALSFAVIFMVTRNGRAEEEAGRTEILRAGVLGNRAYSLASWTVFSVFAMLVGLATAGGAISQGLPAEGALTMGASFAATAIVFAGIAALAGQLTRTGSGANALSSVVLGVSYLVRAVADVQSDGEHATWLTWLSPIGWAQQSRSYDENNWWPLALCLGLAAILFSIALGIQRGRDLGSGIIQERVGPRSASTVLRTQLGLTVRLQRGSIIGWSFGVVVFAVFFGGIATVVTDLFADANLLTGDDAMSKMLLGGSHDLLDGLFGTFMMMSSLIVAAFVLNSADSIRAAESAGRVEMQWSLAISRVRWAASRMAVPAVWSLVLLAASGIALGITFETATGNSGQARRFFLASIAYWPTSLLVIGVVVLCAAVIPRAASAVSWGLYGVVVVLSMFGDLFGLPDWIVDNTPFTAIPHLGMEFSFLPLLVITVLAMTAGGVGLKVLRSRDMTSA